MLVQGLDTPASGFKFLFELERFIFHIVCSERLLVLINEANSYCNIAPQRLPAVLEGVIMDDAG